MWSIFAAKAASFSLIRNRAAIAKKRQNTGCLVRLPGYSVRIRGPVEGSLSGAWLAFCFDAFSLREPVSTSLENAVE
jgi:hypothetical protein